MTGRRGGYWRGSAPCSAASPVTPLIHGARSLVIAGGIVPRFLPFLRSSAFRERFLAKGRFSACLESVTIRVVTHPQPGLLGAAAAPRETT